MSKIPGWALFNLMRFGYRSIKYAVFSARSTFDKIPADTRKPQPKENDDKTSARTASRKRRSTEMLVLGTGPAPVHQCVMDEVANHAVPGTQLTGVTPPAPRTNNFTPAACRGALAPHAWLAAGNSLYDGFGHGFTLLVCNDEDGPDIERAMQDARTLGIPFVALMPRDATLSELYQARLALIRPDQHVAWRGNAWPSAGLDLLQRVTGH